MQQVLSRLVTALFLVAGLVGMAEAIEPVLNFDLLTVGLAYLIVFVAEKKLRSALSSTGFP